MNYPAITIFTLGLLCACSQSEQHEATTGLTPEAERSAAIPKLDSLMTALLTANEDTAAINRLAHDFCAAIHQDGFGELVDPFFHHYMYKPGEPGYGPYNVSLADLYNADFQSFLLYISYPVPDSAFQGLAFVVDRRDNENSLIWYRNLFSRSGTTANVIAADGTNKVFRLQDEDETIIGWTGKNGFGHLFFYNTIEHFPQMVFTEELYFWENVLLDCSVDVRRNGDLAVAISYTVSVSEGICQRLGLGPEVELIRKTGIDRYRYVNEGGNVSYQLPEEPVLSANDMEFLENIAGGEYGYDDIDYLDFVRKYKAELEKLALEGNKDQRTAADYFIEAYNEYYGPAGNP